MGKIFCVMGKSSSGKDTLYKKLLEDRELSLGKIITYTTRPIREGEKDGREYHFTDETGYESLERSGKVIECRVYQTVYGPWRYFTVADENLRDDEQYCVIGTLEAFISLKKYFGDRVVPIYVEVEDGERLQRALNREKTQVNPKYEEMCRRFIADCSDFSDQKIADAEISRRFENVNLNTCFDEIKQYIKSNA